MKRIKTRTERARFLRRTRIYYLVLLAVCPPIVIANNHFNNELPTWQAWLFAAVVAGILVAAIFVIGVRVRELEDRQ